MRGIFDSEEELIDAHKTELIRCQTFFTPKYDKSVITAYLGKQNLKNELLMIHYLLYFQDLLHLL